MKRCGCAAPPAQTKLITGNTEGKMPFSTKTTTKRLEKLFSFVSRLTLRLIFPQNEC